MPRPTHFPNFIPAILMLLTPLIFAWQRPDQPVPAEYQTEVTLYGRFATYLNGVEEDRQLCKDDLTPILPEEIPALYGTANGMTIYADGVDICSWDYAAIKGYHHPLEPVYLDLSDSAGWPDIHVVPGTVAIDPALGRFKLAEGDDDPPSEVGSHWVGFGVPGSGFIRVQGDYAYMPAGEGDMQAIDISDPTAPFVASRAHADFNWTLGIYNDYAYLRRNNRGLSAIDIADPANLQWAPDDSLTRIWEPPGNLSFGDIEIREGLAYLTLPQEPAFMILDLSSDPLHATEVISLTVGDPKGANWIFLSGQRAYVGLNSANGLTDPKVDYTQHWSAGFVVIDISDPQNASVTGTYLGEPGDSLYTLPRLIGVSGDLAVMASVWRPDNPNPPGSPSLPARLRLVDASDPGNIHQVGEYPFLVPCNGDQWCNEPRIDLYSSVPKGEVLYVSDDSNDSTSDSLNYGNPEDYTSLFTFDISNPETPELVDRYDEPLPSRYRHLTLSGDTLLVNDYNYGMRVFDTSVITAPLKIGGVTTAAEGRHAWVNDRGTNVYYTQTFGGTIYTLDISQPAQPLRQGVYWDGEWSEKARLVGRGDTLYVPTAEFINIIDMTDPISPTKSGHFPDVFGASVISLFGNHAYVLTMETGAGGEVSRSYLRIYDISDPANPTVSGGLGLGSTIRREKVFTQGDYAYVVSNGELLVIEVSDPAHPTLAGQLTDARLTISSRDEAGRMWVRGGYAYIITGSRDTDWFHIADVSDPENPTYETTYLEDVPITTDNHVTDMIVSGKHLILGLYSGNFALFDLTDSLNPAYVADGWQINSTYGPLSWTLGRLVGDYLAVPTLSHLVLVDMPFDSQALTGAVTVKANLLYRIALPLVFRGE